MTTNPTVEPTTVEPTTVEPTTVEPTTVEPTTVEPTTEDPRYTGIVKWFNNKAGFGFITVCDEGNQYTGKDIFVHYTFIRVLNLQYKYLVQGEYVNFTIVASESDAHEYQAIDVCGVKGGSIMCETRRASIQQYPKQAPHRQYIAPRNTNSVGPRNTNSVGPPSNRGPPPATRKQPTQVDKDGFTLVKRKK